MSEFIEKRIRDLKPADAGTIDGFKRPAEMEERINIVCRGVLGSDEGEKLMNYLQSITVMTVMPPSATDAELRMQEGMRRLFGILDARRRSTPK
jgi:hypothetical protein